MYLATKRMNASSSGGALPQAGAGALIRSSETWRLDTNGVEIQSEDRYIVAVSDCWTRPRPLVSDPATGSPYDRTDPPVLQTPGFRKSSQPPCSRGGSEFLHEIKRANYDPCAHSANHKGDQQPNHPIHEWNGRAPNREV
jgi:hypothetical protein